MPILSINILRKIVNVFPTAKEALRGSSTRCYRRHYSAWQFSVIMLVPIAVGVERFTPADVGAVGGKTFNSAWKSSGSEDGRWRETCRWFFKWGWTPTQSSTMQMNLRQSAVSFGGDPSEQMLNIWSALPKAKRHITNDNQMTWGSHHAGTWEAPASFPKGG